MGENQNCGISSISKAVYTFVAFFVIALRDSDRHTLTKLMNGVAQFEKLELLLHPALTSLQQICNKAGKLSHKLGRMDKTEMNFKLFKLLFFFF